MKAIKITDREFSAICAAIDFMSSHASGADDKHGDLILEDVQALISLRDKITKQ